MHPQADRLTKARAGLVLDAPFFGSLALRLGLREDSSVETAWTDGVTLGYNPKFIATLSLEECKGLLAHEVMHLAAAHHARRQSREQRRWNIAGDMAINPLLTACKFRLPTGALTGTGTDQAAESIYNTLPDGGSSGNGQGQGDGASQPQPGQDSDPGRSGEVRDAPAPDGGQASASDLQQAEAESKVAVAQAAQAAKMCGKLPKELARLIEETLRARVPWREVLRRFVDQASRDDYTWRQPNPRYLAAGFYLPSLRNEVMRPIAVAIDTSGSIDRVTLDQFAGELTGILEDTRASTTIIYCDAEVSGVEDYTPDSLPVTLSPKGGGGTDFRPPFAEVERRGDEPSCLVYLTDGECSSFPQAPEYPVLWAIVGGRQFKPPFGEVIEVRD